MSKPADTPLIPPDVSQAPVVLAPRAQIVCFGDSLTQRGSEPGGWVTLLSHWYSRRADVLNRGYSGYNTQHARTMLHEHQARGMWPTTTHADAPPSLTCVCFGANDSCLASGMAGWQHVSVPQFSENLAAILRALGQTDEANADGARRAAPRVVLIGPPQIDAQAWGRNVQTLFSLPTVPVTRDNAVTSTYSAAARDVAQRFRVPFVDMYALTPEAEWTDLLCDGLHFTPAGNRRLFDVLRDAIEREWPDLAAASMPLDAPPFQQLQKFAPEQALRLFKEPAQASDKP